MTLCDECMSNATTVSLKISGAAKRRNWMTDLLSGKVPIYGISMCPECISQTTQCRNCGNRFTSDTWFIQVLTSLRGKALICKNCVEENTYNPSRVYITKLYLKGVKSKLKELLI